MYNANVQALSANHLPWKSNYTFWVCVCSLKYPACNAHGSYYHLWPVRLQHVSTLSHKFT